MAQYYNVKWMGQSGKVTTTSTRNPNRVTSEVQDKGGRILRVWQPYTSRKRTGSREKVFYNERTKPSKQGMIVRKEGWDEEPTQEQRDTSLDYLLSHAEPTESERLKMTWLQTSRKTPRNLVFYNIATRKAYASLTPKEKEEYGFRYTDWESVPIEERKHYYGASQHFESLPKEEQRELGKQYYEETTKDGLGDFDITEFGTKMAGGVWKYGGDPDVWKEKAHEYMYEKASTPSGKLKDIYFGKLPAPVRWWTSGFHAAASWATFPITLTQTGVKLATGKGDLTDPLGRIRTGKTFLPDIGKFLERHRPGSPLDIASVGISEGIGALTGEGSDEWERFQRDPISGIFATVGAGVGYLTGTSILRGIGYTSKLGFKYTIRGLPKVYGRYESFIGKTPTYLEHGGRVLPKTFGTKIGQTKYWQHLHGWSTGELVKVKAIPIKLERFYKGSRTGVQEDAFNIYGKLTKYRGFGKSEWIPKGLAGQYRIGDYIFHSHLFRPSTYRGRIVKGMGTRSQISETVFMSKPKGCLWWKRGKIQTSSIRELEKIGSRFYPKYPKDPFVSGGFDYSASREFIKRFTSQMNKATDKHFIRLGFDHSVARESMKSFSWAGLKKSDVAYTSLVPRTQLAYQPMIHGAKATGSLMGKVVYVPTSMLPGVSVSSVLAMLSKLDYRSDVAQDLDRISLPAFDLKQPSMERMDTRQLQIQQPLQESLSLSSLEQVQKQLQKQELKQAQLSQQAMIHPQETTTRMYPHISRARHGKGKYIPYVFGPKMDLELGAVKEEGQGYKVKVRERHYVKGKRVKWGDFKTLPTSPMNKGAALSLGGTITDRSAAASYKVFPVKGKPKSSNLKVSNWNSIAHKFYKKGDVFIEKTAHRIDSQGEREQITALGLLAQMKRSAPKRQRKLQPRYVSTKTPRVRVDKQVFKPLSFKDMKQGFRKISKEVFF